jgi:hypothetical protein
MPNWKKLIVSGSDASLNSLNVTNNVTAQSFTGSFSGSFTAPGATTQVVYNDSGVLAASSNFVFSGSRVGVGTTTPGAIVDIASNGGRLRLTQNTAGSTFNGIDFVSYNGSAYGGFVGNQDTGEIRLNATSTYFPTFYSSGAEVMRISTSGNVGIGTTSPVYKFDVRGQGYFATVANTNQLTIGDTTNGTIAAISQTNENLSFLTGASTTRLFISSSGNVGIGTTSPGRKLDVYTDGGFGATNSYLRITAAAAGAYSLNSFIEGFHDDYGNGEKAKIAWINFESIRPGANDVGGNINFYTKILGGANSADPTVKMTITSAGSVGIGTTSPTTKLDVIGNSYISGSLSVKTNSTAGTGLTVGGSTVLLSFAEIQQGNPLYLYSSGNTYYSTIRQDSQNLILTPDTNVGIGTTSPTAKLEVNGNVKATSFTGSFSGSITHAVSASYALTSSYASFAQTAGAASTATSASYALSSSYALSASYAVTASHALTASYINPLNQDLILTGSFIATGGVTASNALINGNLTVIGTASFTYTTASYVNVGASTITLNTDNPAVRFGGINVVDSGSFGTSSTGSLLWDSEKNRWIYSNPSGSTYDGGLLISGPRNTTGLGNEQGTTLNALMKGQGGDHITSSGMFEDSSGNVGVGTASPSAKFEVVGNVKATSFTGSFSGSFTAPGSTTQIVYNNGGVLSADSGFVYSGSNVGIGITAPTEKLHIVSSATGNQFGRITATDSNSSAAWVAQNDSGDNVVYRVFSSGVSGTQMGNALGRSASLLANLGGSGVFLLGTFSNTNFVLGTNNTENMRITTAGNVGIGTSSPLTRLDLRASSNSVITPLASIPDTATTLLIGNTGTNGVLALGHDNAGHPWLQGRSVLANQAAEDILINPLGGNVGIGTTNPTYKLHVSSSNNNDGIAIHYPANNFAEFPFIISSNADSAGNYVRINTDIIELKRNGGASTIKTIGSSNNLTLESATNLIFNTNGASERMRIDTSGNVGIGTGSPQTGFKLDVNGSTVTRGEIYSNSDIIGFGANENYKIAESGNTWLAKTSGNVGIGTTSPTSKLDVRGTLTVSGSGANVDIKSTTTTSTLNIYGSDTSTNFLGVGILSDNVTRWRAGMVDSRKYQIAYADGGGSFTPTAAMTIVSGSGNVGIGYTSPQYKLDIDGSFNTVTSGVYLTYNSGIIYHGSSYYQFPSGTYYYLYGRTGMGLIFGSNNAEVGRFDLSGNLGIGTTSPSAKLHVNGTFISNALWTDAGSVGYWGNYSTAYGGLTWDTGYAMVFASGGNALRFGTNGTSTRMTIDTSGNVGIGTTSPASKLQIGSVGSTGYSVGNGLAFGDGTRAGALNVDSNGTTLYSSTNLVFSPGTTEAVRITSAGNVGIGTTSPNSQLDAYTSQGGSKISTTHGTGGSYPKASGISFGATSTSLTVSNNGGTTVFTGGAGIYASNGAASNNPTDLLFWTTAAGTPAERMTITSGGNVGIGTSSPGYKLEVVGAVSASTYYGDGSNLTNIGSGSISAAGSDGQLQYNNSGLFGGASRLYYNDSTNRVGIGTSSPGYDLDVSGSVRVQDRLRVGVVNTGNGVIHQSSDATINPTSATVVWSVPGSAGICAFIEYYVFNSNTGTSQRAGNIVTTWNASGTPQITHTETSTPDIGSTSPITFSTGLTLGGDPQLIATNSGGDIWYMIMNYRYF